ncbi:MAG: PAS domain-containing protein, partial [Fibrobacter sp.]|nr:PAS domain-containing protein [Fibrobacter sp.]
ITGFAGKFYTGIVSTWYGFTAANSVLANIAILIFLIIPVFFSAIISYQQMHTTHAEKIFRSIFVSQMSAIIAGFIMDAILPALGLFIYGESASIFLFIITLFLYRANTSLARTGIDMPKSLKHVIQELDEGILILNSKGKIELSNRAACKLFGVGEKALLQKSITQFIPDITVLGPMNNIPIYLKNNSVSATITITPLTSNGILYGYKALLRDLRKNNDMQQRFSRLQAEFNDERDSIRLRIVNLQQLYQQQQIFLNSLLNNLPSRLWAKNLKGAYTQQNNKDIAVRGNIKSHIEDPIFTPQEAQAMESPGKTVVQNETTIDENGKKHWEKHTVVPLYDEAFRIKGVLGLIEDTTDFHALEEERNQLRENLVKASTFEDMSNVAGGLAHDFNNLLAGIIGYRDLAEATLPKSEDCARTKKYLGNMQKSL